MYHDDCIMIYIYIYIIYIIYIYMIYNYIYINMIYNYIYMINIYTNIAKIARIVTPPEKRNNFSDFSQFSGLIGGFSQQPGILATLFLSPNFDHPPVHDAS